MQEFARWLREARKAAKLSQELLAAEVLKSDELAGFHQTRLSAWERAYTVPALRQYNAIASALGLSEEQKAHGKRLWEAADHEYFGVLHAPSCADELANDPTPAP